MGNSIQRHLMGLMVEMQEGGLTFEKNFSKEVNNLRLNLLSRTAFCYLIS
jgi:hypothetical protein